MNGGQYDLLVIGGGVNGCGIARDAAGRGYRVALVEKDDLASGTSSKSTKLVHGGLRYLESLQIRLVREALAERETLWRIAPHLVQPLRFVVPVLPDARPAWLLRLGLFLYDHLGAREKLPGASSLDLRRAAEGAPLKPQLVKAFAFSDCRVDDSRLVVLNARDAADRGAAIFTRTTFVRAQASDGVWSAVLRDEASGAEKGISARFLVNAAGPWADRVLAGVVGPGERPRLRLVRGSHIVAPKLFDHDGAYLFQTGDGRVVFAIGYWDDFTLIGTTDVDFDGAPDEVGATSEEIAYLCRAANGFFRRPIAPRDVVWSFSGLRPLQDDGQPAARASRDYRLDQKTIDGSPLISLFGGKLTAYRRVAEQVVDAAAASLGSRGHVRTHAWTSSAVLPGGDFPDGDLDAFSRDLAARYPFLAAAEARRLARAYGTLCLGFLGAARSRADLGRDFGDTGCDTWGDASGLGLSEAEVDYLVAREWARTADDILWRRSKLGLRAPNGLAATLDAFLARS